jgi:hypothetical protein
MEFGSVTNLGYCFINLVSEAKAAEFVRKINKHRLGGHGSRPLVTARSRVQGFLNNFENFRNSRVMGVAVPPEFQPIIIDPETGAEVPFPPPNRKLRKTKKVDAGLRSLQQRYFSMVSTVTTERNARLIVNHTAKMFQPHEQRAGMEALVRRAAADYDVLWSGVQSTIASLVAAGKLQSP